MEAEDWKVSAPRDHRLNRNTVTGEAGPSKELSLGY